jgi:hypothetical protein
MPKVLQVRNVPDSLHRALRERAARRGRSLSTFVVEQFQQVVDEVPLDEWLDEVHRHPQTRLRSRVVDVLRRERHVR